MKGNDNMNNLINILAINELEGGTYTIDTILEIIKQLTDWAIAIGLALSGLVIVVGFISLTLASVEQKPRVEQKLIQTGIGIGGIIVAISLVNIIIRLFK